MPMNRIGPCFVARSRNFPNSARRPGSLRVGPNQIAKPMRLLPALDLKYLSAVGRQQLFRGLDACDPARLLLIHFSHSAPRSERFAAGALFFAAGLWQGRFIYFLMII